MSELSVTRNVKYSIIKMPYDLYNDTFSRGDIIDDGPTYEYLISKDRLRRFIKSETLFEYNWNLKYKDYDLGGKCEIPNIECSICYVNPSENDFKEKLKKEDEGVGGLEIYSDKYKMIKTECGHIFCKKCISEWALKTCKIKNNKYKKGFYMSCPCCRSDVKCGSLYAEAKDRFITCIKFLFTHPGQPAGVTCHELINSHMNRMKMQELKDLADWNMLNFIHNTNLELKQIKGKKKEDLKNEIYFRINDLEEMYSKKRRRNRREIIGLPWNIVSN